MYGGGKRTYGGVGRNSLIKAYQHYFAKLIDTNNIVQGPDNIICTQNYYITFLFF